MRIHTKQYHLAAVESCFVLIRTHLVEDLGTKSLIAANHTHTDQFLGGMLWKTRSDQFMIVKLLKCHSSVFLSHIYYNDVFCRIVIVVNT